MSFQLHRVINAAHGYDILWGKGLPEWKGMRCLGIGSFASIGLRSGQVSNRHSPLLCVMQLLAHAVRARFAIAVMKYQSALPEQLTVSSMLFLTTKEEGRFLHIRFTDTCQR